MSSTNAPADDALGPDERRLSSEGASRAANGTRGALDIGINELRTVFETYPGGMSFSRSGIIFAANPGLARMLQTSVDDIIGRQILDFIVPDDRARISNYLARDYMGPYETTLIRGDGTILPVESTASIVQTDGAPVRFTVLRDISERKNAQEQIESQRLLLEAILEHIPASVFVIAVPTGRPILVNRFARYLFKRNSFPEVPKEKLSEEYAVYIAGTDTLYPVERMPIIRAMSGETSVVDDMELRYPDGTSRLLQIVGAPIYDAAGKITMTVGIAQDITARKRAEEKLQAEQEFLRRLIRAHERDRQLMAYELHDGLVQYITAAVWHLDALVDTAALADDWKQALERTQQLLRQALGDARRFLSGLRPPVLDEQGIATALEYLVAETKRDAPNLEVTLECDPDLRRLEPLLEGTIFRIVQESLSNIRKHSQATHAWVKFGRNDARLHLEITDNGRGFPVSEVPAERFGLQGIRKRAELLGGSATINSTPGKGTQINVELPLLAASEAD